MSAGLPTLSEPPGRRNSRAGFDDQSAMNSRSGSLRRRTSRSYVTGIAVSPLLNLIALNGEQYIVYEAVAATAVTTGGITVYARTTSRDFSRIGGWLFAALIGVVVAMVIGIFVQSTAFQIFISAAACVVFSLFLLYDIQRVTTTGNAPGNAIRMALKIYLDVFNLFLNLLMILMMTQGGGNSRR